MRYTRLFKIAQQQPNQAPNQPTAFKPYTLSYSDVFRQATGDPNYIQKFKDHIGKYRQAYEQIFQPTSLQKFVTDFNPNARMHIKPGEESYALREVNAKNYERVKKFLGDLQSRGNIGKMVAQTVGQYVNMPIPIKPESTDSALTSEFVRSIYGAPSHLPKLNVFNSHSNNPAIRSYMKFPLGSSATENKWDVAAHQFTHALARNRSYQRDASNGQIKYYMQDPYALHLRQSDPVNWLEDYKSIPLAINTKQQKITPIVADPYPFDPLQRVQAQMAINRGRNLMKNTLKKYPFAYPKLDYFTRQYLLNMPDRWQNQQQADQFFNKVLFNPRLLQALPIEAKRGVGNRHLIQYHLNKAKAGAYPSDFKYKQFRPVNYLNNLQNWYKNAWVLTNNRRPNRMPNNNIRPA